MKEINLKLANESLAERVANEIELLITENSLKIGDKLPNEFDLASSLQVGRGTIREAVKILSSRNIIEVKRGKGTFVSDQPGVMKDPLGLRFLQTDELELAYDLLAVRMMVEPSITGLAAINASEDEINQMESLAEEISKQIEAGQSHEKKDQEFHSLIAIASKNVVVPKLVPIIHTGVSLFINVTNNKLENETILTHNGIVEAIKKRNPEEAEQWMVRHLEYNKLLLNDLKEAKLKS